MADIIISIEEPSNYGYYHALDAVVKKDDILKINTQLSGTFTVNIDNRDAFFSNAGKFISKEVTNTSGDVVIGTVANGPTLKKTYIIYADSASIFIDLDAPPRIIRVS